MIVRRKTSVHEKTVQAVAKGTVKKPARKPTIRRSPNSKVIVKSIDPLLKKWIADQHVAYNRVKIESPTSIVILNPKG